MKIQIIKPEEMSYTETSEVLEQIKKEEKRRKKAEKEYVSTEADTKEIYRRLGEGEDIDNIMESISNRSAALQPAPPKPMPIPSVKPYVQPPIQLPIQPFVQPPIQPFVQPPIQSTESIESTPEYLLERARKKAKREEKKIIKSWAQRIDYPVGECCSNVCDTLNNDLAQYLGLISPSKDEKLAFDTLGELRRQFYLRGTCQCANGHIAESSGIPLLKKQPENCCPHVCEILNNTIDEYEGILLPTHNTRIISETLHNIRAKMYNNNACKCVETEEQLKKQTRSGPGMDPILQNRLTQLLKYAEKQGWVK